MLLNIMNMKTSHKLFGAFMLLTLVAIASDAIIWRNLLTLEQNNERTIHTYQVTDHAKAIVTSMVNGETGLCGFLVAGEDEFLEPYRNSEREFRQAWGETKRLTSDNPAQQKRLDQIAAAAAEWRREVAEREIALMKSPQTVTEARELEASGVGKKSMDGIRALVNELVDVEAGLLTVRAAALAAATTSSYTAIIASAGGRSSSCLRCCS